MNGGTTFDFLDASPAQALAQARQAAAGGDVRIGGGPSTIREFLAAGLIDYLHIVVVPIVLGRGERLWDGLEGLDDRFQIEAVNSPSGVTHVTLSRRPALAQQRELEHGVVRDQLGGVRIQAVRPVNMGRTLDEVVVVRTHACSPPTEGVPGITCSGSAVPVSDAQ
jgi:RibD C-terminal domain